jgi:NitT/TauT family transport system permease protein
MFQTSSEIPVAARRRAAATAQRLAPALAPWGVLVLLWYLCTKGERPLIDPLFLSSPSDTLTALREGLRNAKLINAFGMTFGRALGGFLIATVIGVPLGLVLGGIAAVQRMLGNVVDALRSMPATALYPLFMFAFGSGSLSKIAVAAFVCTWAIAIYTAHGVSGSGQTRRFLLRMHRVSRTQFLLDGLLFPAMPAIIGGMRTAVSLAVVLTIGIEMIVGTTSGLGQAIFNAQNTYQIPDMYAAIVLAAVGGVLVNRGFVFFAQWLAPWSQEDTGLA